MKKPVPARPVPNTLKQQEAARYLASLGGTMPDLEYIPRRREDILPDPDSAEN